MQPSQLKRREFITLFGGAVAIVSSRIVLGQQTDRMPRVGVLMAFPESDLESQRRAEAFQQRLRELGLQDGRNIHIDFRWGTAEPDQTARNAKELIDLKPNVLVGTTTPGVAALLRETRTIPIVFVGVADPVGQRFITSLARPGGNITGFTSFEFSLGGKWLEILKEIAPQVARAAILFNPDTVPYAGFVRSIEAAAPAFAVLHLLRSVHGHLAAESACPHSRRVWRITGPRLMPELALMDEPMAGSKRDIVPPLHEHGAKGGSHGNPHAAAKLHWHTWLRADVVGARPATFPAHESNRTGLLPLLADRAVTYGSTIYRAFQKRPVQKAPATI